MIRAPFDDPAVLARLRPLWEAERSLVLPGACDPVAPKAKFAEFSVAHRGVYEVAKLRAQPALQRFAEGVTGLRLKTAWTRLYRLRHRSYSLFYDDALTRLDEGVEVTLDLSQDAGGPPAVYQSSPSQRLIIPQSPGLVALVERAPSLYRYDRYLPAGSGPVLRLRAAFRRAD